MKPKILFGVPTGGSCKPEFVASLVHTVASYGHFGLALVEGSMLMMNREKIVDVALAGEADYLCFVDDDMGFTPAAVESLLSRDLPLVGCNYRRRVPPSEFTAVGKDGTFLATTEASAGVEEVLYFGFGLCLIRREVLEAVEPPRFPVVWSPESKRYAGEDHTFMAQARTKGFPAYVDHDASKGVYHVGGLSYHWHEDYSKLP